MNRRVAFPFLTLSDAAVTATPWQVSLNSADWIEMGEFLSDWDPSSSLRLRRRVGVTPEIAAQNLLIPPDDLYLEIVVRVGTGQGRLPRMVLKRIRHPAISSGAEFEIEVLGRELSVVLELRTEIVLAGTPRSSAPLSPRVLGDRLWSDNARLHLEGEEPRFPIETADLGALLGHSVSGSAPWHLYWSPRDWNRDFHGAVRLYLNEKDNPLLERVERQDIPTLQLLLADVMGQVCERFVQDPEAADLMEHAEPGSLGAQAAIWLRRAWPDKDAKFIRAVLESRPGLFRSTFLGLAELTED